MPEAINCECVAQLIMLIAVVIFLLGLVFKCLDII